ncbi:HAMP domain-containing protein [Kineosporia sp. J2-2]|uniref:histidine kinase n=1 Tax=Kineosporia corallincola TaxID=2835133 RepID=A0ABS5TAP1_9ACTN|nr:ATP-binding protein [Kineosporia corallincola]MBT0768140.1 HAMP domain-containing protein [Kineosporia corallincola]
MSSEHGWRFDAAAAPHRLLPSVRARSTVSSVLVVGMALALAGGLIFYVLQHALISGLNQAADARLNEVAGQLELLGEGELDDSLKKTQNQRDGQWVQVLKGDSVVSASTYDDDQGPITGLRPGVGEVLREDAGVLKIFDTDRPFLVVTRGVEYKGETDTIIVATFLEWQRRTVVIVLGLLAVAFPLLLIAVGVVVWVMLGRALRPVEEIRARVAHIDERELADRVPVPPTRDEVAALAYTMNEMLDRIQTAQKAQRQFVSDASHELRSPLATLSATLEVVDSDVTGRAWDELRPVLRNETQRMGVLVQNLLLLARADDQGLKIVQVEVDLDDLVMEEVRRLRTSTALEVPVSVTPVRILGDPYKLGQVLRNLVDNAVRYAEHTVALSLTVVGSTALVMVDDDGPGIAPSDRDRVFERFVRLDESRDRASGGAGLGLPIVREVVRGHAGDVAVGVSPYGGARFQVQLPVTVEPLTGEIPLVVPASGGGTGGQPPKG